MGAQFVHAKSRIDELNASVSSLQKDSKAKDDKIASLEADKTKAASDVTNLQNANATKEQEIARLRNQVGIAQQALQALQE